MNGNDLWARFRYEVLLAGILLLSGFLNLWNIWNQGYSNAYYAAAVKSMLANPQLLLFNSFDSAGFITVDKPPFGLWVQAASATLFGFSGWSLVLPQALAGVGSVALVYLIVSRGFGKPAGLVSALALALTPIFVAVSRNETMDGILIFLLLLAIWAALKAARESSLPCLVLAAVLVGIGFNTKMIQAFIVVPAILAVYFFGARRHAPVKRVLHIALAVVVLLAVSFSWALAVDAVPADQRPFIGGSGDNTVMGLTLNYNGLHRLESDGSGPGAGSTFPGGMQNRTADRMSAGTPGEGPGVPAMAGSPPQDGGTGFSGAPSFSALAGNQTGRDGIAPGSPVRGDSPGGMSGAGSPSGNAGSGSGGVMSAGRGGGMGDETGSPGPFRLFGEGLAGQITWLLPLALIGLLALGRRPASLSLKGLDDAGLSGEKGLVALAMGLWLLPGLLYFSFTTGFWHTYYLATIAPPLAAMAGIGAVAMYGAWTRDGWQGWLLVIAVVVTGFVQMVFLMYTAEWSGPLPAIVGCGSCILAIVLAWMRIKGRDRITLFPKAIAIIAVGLLFVAPFVWACTPLMNGTGGNLPKAGPQTGGPGGMDGMGSGINAPTGAGAGGSTSGLANYLLAHTTTETWIVAEPSSMSAASLILETGKPVMALGGFAGSDQVLTLEQMKKMVSEGRVRFFYAGGGMGGGGNSGNSAIFSWVESTCTAVPSSAYETAATGSGITGTGRSMAARSVNATGSFPGMSGGMNGLSALFGGSAAGGTGGLYDCAAYRKIAAG